MEVESLKEIKVTESIFLEGHQKSLYPPYEFLVQITVTFVCLFVVVVVFVSFCFFTVLEFEFKAYTLSYSTSPFLL
jgi:hypothetical protein